MLGPGVRCGSFWSATPSLGKGHDHAAHSSPLLATRPLNARSASLSFHWVHWVFVSRQPSPELAPTFLDQKSAKVLRQSVSPDEVEASTRNSHQRKTDPATGEPRALAFLMAGGLHDDNACAGCHFAQRRVGDTQSIAIRDSENPGRGRTVHGPRNQRRTPMVAYTPFSPG